MTERLVIVNRGEIARRILRAGRERGYRVAVISTPADRDALVRREADDVLEVSSFLDRDAIVDAARGFGAHLLHPGYGFLAEDPDFASRVEEAGIVWVGPTPDSMRALGNKEAARTLAAARGVPTLAALSSAELQNLTPSTWEKALQTRGIPPPYLVKASGGGGGRGMRLVSSVLDLPGATRRASEEAREAFGDARVFIERYLDGPRHIEVQVFGDGAGGGVFFGERECSLQRRHQKVVEEAPSAAIDARLREALGRAALELVRETRYRSAGTIEFLLSPSNEFYFMEANTRLQVEHPTTEMVYGIDLVQAQLELAEGRWPAGFPDPNGLEVLAPKGAAIEARVLAEDPRHDFRPTPGPLVLYREPSGDGIRVDSGVAEGGRVSSAFDSLIAKVIAWGPSRGEAIERLKDALAAYIVHGPTTNLPFLQAIARHPDFRAGRVSTRWIDDHLASLNAPLLPDALVAALQLGGFRERLSLAVAAGGMRPAIFAERFGAQASDAFRVGSELERPAVYVTKGVARGEVLLSGPGIEAARALPAFASRVSVGELQLTLLGDTLRLTCPRHTPRAAGDASQEGEIRSPMAGKVLEVCIQEGQEVEAGQVAFVVESMKMQLEVRAPVKGHVQRIHVAAGQVLPGPEVMATLA